MTQLRLFPFIAPPSAGKGTQTAILCERYGLPKIDMGSQLRIVAKKDTPLGQRVAQILADGQLVDTPIVMAVLHDGLEDIRAAAAAEGKADVSVLLDGFPRNQEQTEALFALCDEGKAQIIQAFYLDVPFDMIRERSIHRRMDKETGAIYNLKFNPPPEGVGEERLIHREDDHPERVEKRLVAYGRETAPILDAFESRHLLTRVDGSQEITQVSQSLIRLFDEYLTAQVSA
jgi:adenylate kinase